MKSERECISCVSLISNVRLFLDHSRFWNSQSGDADFAHVDSACCFTRIVIPTKHAWSRFSEAVSKNNYRGTKPTWGINTLSLHPLTTEIFVNYNRYFSWVDIFQICRVPGYGTLNFPHLYASRGKHFTAVMFSFQAVALWTRHGWQACTLCNVREYAHSLSCHQSLGIRWLD